MPINTDRHQRRVIPGMLFTFVAILVVAVALPVQAAQTDTPRVKCWQEYASAKAKTTDEKALAELGKKYDACVDKVEPSNWVVEKRTDKMSGADITFAFVESDETLNLAFPYQGAQRPKLTVRKKGKAAPEVIFSIDRGQITDCDVYTCRVVVKFDDGKPTTVRANKTSDGASDKVFLPNSLAPLIAKAKKVMVQVTFYRQGAHTLTFNVAGYPVK